MSISLTLTFILNILLCVWFFVSCNVTFFYTLLITYSEFQKTIPGFHVLLFSTYCKIKSMSLYFSFFRTHIHVFILILSNTVIYFRIFSFKITERSISLSKLTHHILIKEGRLKSLYFWVLTSFHSLILNYVILSKHKQYHKLWWLQKKVG